MKIELDFSPLGPLAAQLRSVGAEQLGRTALEVVNSVTRQFDKEQRAGQVADLNLPRSDVDAVTSRVLAASPANPRAQISTRVKLTVLDRYGAAPYKRPSETDRIGRRLGDKQGGVFLPIKRSAPVRRNAMFMLPLLNNPGRRGVFVRTSATGGKPKHVYGPSPYSLFRFQIKTREADLVQTLQVSAAEALGLTLEKGLRK